MLRRLVGTTAPGHHDCSIQEGKKLVIMALCQSPLTVTLWPSSFLKKYGPMIPPVIKAHPNTSNSFTGSFAKPTLSLIQHLKRIKIMKIKDSQKNPISDMDSKDPNFFRKDIYASKSQREKFFEAVVN
ncbi:hypothetical protein TNCV_1082191, partial [Trichonephila clavipes]